MSGGTRLSSVDLFAGAGGLTLGLRRAGFDTVLAIDDWGPAVGTLRRNFGEAAVAAGCVRELTASTVLALSATAWPPAPGARAFSNAADCALLSATAAPPRSDNGH